MFLWIYGSPNEVLPKKLIFYLYKCILDVNRQYVKEVKNKLRFKISPLEKYFYAYKLILNIKSTNHAILNDLLSELPQ